MERMEEKLRSNVRKEKEKRNSGRGETLKRSEKMETEWRVEER